MCLMNDKKILFVTGASSDVGNALIKKVSDRYQVIWAHYCNSQERLNELKNEYGEKIVPIQADFSNRKSTQDLIGKIIESGNFPDHIVHLSSPKTFNQRFQKCMWEDYQKGMDTSLQSIITILQAFLPHMVKKKYGKVVFMLTDCVIGRPPRFQSPYVVVKYALLGLMKSLAVEYMGKGITVNGVSPDMIETRFLSNIPELVVEQNAQNSPLGRNLTVNEVVPAFEYFLSDGADVVTGQNIGVTGGQR